MLLKAWIKINSTMSDWKLVIVGEGEDRPKMTEFIDNNNLIDSVELVGRAVDMSNHYKRAEIFFA